LCGASHGAGAPRNSAAGWPEAHFESCRSAWECELGRGARAQAEAGLAAVAAARARALEDLDQAISQSLELLGGPTDPAAPEALAADRVIAANARRALALMKALQARARAGAPTYCSRLLRAERVALPCGKVVSRTCVVRCLLCLRLCSIAVRHNHAPPVPPIHCRAHAQLFSRYVLQISHPVLRAGVRPEAEPLAVGAGGPGRRRPGWRPAAGCPAVTMKQGSLQRKAPSPC